MEKCTTPREIREIQLYLLDNFVKICERNSVIYWLEGGSALGAYRHKGFIPWDDDIDVGIFYKDINLLLEKLKEELPNDIFLQDGSTDDYPDVGFPIKLRYNPSSMIEKIYLESNYVKTHNINQGIFIDIFPFSQVPFRMKFGISKLVYNLISINNEIMFELYEKKEGKKKIIFTLIRRFKSKKVLREFIRIYRFLGKIFNRDLYAIDIQYFIQKDFYKKEDILPTKKLWFENKLYNVPGNIENYLLIHYGKDYMKLPTINEQKDSIHAIEYKILNN